MIEKILELVFSFAKAPKELQEASKINYQALMRMQKADTQMKVWKIERDAAKLEYVQTGEAFQKLLDAWDPNDVKGAKAQERAQ